MGEFLASKYIIGGIIDSGAGIPHIWHCSVNSIEVPFVISSLLEPLVATMISFIWGVLDESVSLKDV